MQRIVAVLAHPITSMFLRVAFGCLFLYSGVSKLGDLKNFAEALANYDLLPRFMHNGFALIVPWLEIMAGVAVLTGVFLRGGALLLLVLLLVFTGAVAVSIARGIDITCGCALPFAEAARVGWKKLFENLCLLMVAWSVYRYGRPAIRVT